MNIRDRQMLEADIPHFEREIRQLYRKFDEKFGLRGARIPIHFTFDESILGSYTPPLQGKKECFTFSLFFIGYCNKEALHRADKIDLYAHEYAHYMQYNYEIPDKYCFQSGKHGSAWKYCCSLVNAAPTEYYRIGEGLLKHDYSSALYHAMSDPHYVLKDQRRQEQRYQAAKNSQIKYKQGEFVEHPTFGRGEILDIIQKPDSVRLKIRFAAGEKLIDQKWLERQKYK